MRITNLGAFPILITIEISGAPPQPLWLIGSIDIPDAPICSFSTSVPTSVTVIDWRGLANPLNIHGKHELEYRNIEYCKEILVTPLFLPPRIENQVLEYDPNCGGFKSTGVSYL